jgi:hypothetical protein
MEFVEIDRDHLNGFSLLKDASDPPRYYLQAGRRRDLIAIGDRDLALKRFAFRADEPPMTKQRRNRTADVVVMTP